MLEAVLLSVRKSNEWRLDCMRSIFRGGAVGGFLL